jgi:hypothetical protein
MSTPKSAARVVVFLVAALSFTGCSTAIGTSAKSGDCRSALNAVVEANGASESATAAFNSVLRPLLTESSGDFAEAVTPGQLAADRYRSEAAAYSALSSAAPAPYSDVSAAVADSYTSIADATDALVLAAGTFASTKSSTNYEALKSALLADQAALAAGKATRDDAKQLSGNGICQGG